MVPSLMAVTLQEEGGSERKSRTKKGREEEKIGRDGKNTTQILDQVYGLGEENVQTYIT